MSESFKLIIEDDEGRRSVVPIDLGEVSVGRLEGNTIRLNERNVSRHHARIFRDNGSVLAEDLDSYNGVFINGDRVKGRQQIHEGDLVRIGDFHLELRGEGLQRRSEETTQRTVVPELEATQPEIRYSEGPPPPPMPGGGTDGDGEVEPTAIIRMEGEGDGPEAAAESTVLTGAKPKLICLSGAFAGKEFAITQAEMVDRPHPRQRHRDRSPFGIATPLQAGDRGQYGEDYRS